jgi:hypothetical protein
VTSPEPALPVNEQGRRTPPRRGYLVPGIIALVVLAVIALVIDVTALQSHSPSSIVGQEVEQDISSWAQAQEGLSSPVASCPAHEPKRDGAVFYCTLTASGRTRTVRVTELSPAVFHLQFAPGA